MRYPKIVATPDGGSRFDEVEIATTETAVAKDELRKIALLRLQKELDG